MASNNTGPRNQGQGNRRQGDRRQEGTPIQVPGLLPTEWPEGASPR
jgi:hypothetical protein